MRVAICIATCRRPRWLAASLKSLAELVIDKGSTELRVIVVDNDPAGTAREPVSAVQPAFPWPLSYELEPQQGISFARNRAVRLALGWEADFLAFLDDDETASPGWLTELLLAQQEYNADVVTGPVLPLYEAGVAEWAVQGRFFERPRHRSGTFLKCARSGNCLVSRSLVARSSTPFHPAFALGGGGDTHFFRRVHREGARIVWADAAVVHERVPASRATVGWVLRRAYRGGTSFALSERLLHPTRTWMLLRVGTGAGRALQGLMLLLPSLLLGRAGIVRALRTACIGAGLLAGVLGMSYREYRVIHGE
jgi:succinoglycan biosynthesis protein ExoM